VAHFCPEAPVLAPGQQVFVLFAADGTPILVTDSLESAKANASMSSSKRSAFTRSEIIVI
jgi:hypothetical protein